MQITKIVRLLTLAAGVVSAQGALSAELISNGGFEAGLSNWTVTNTGSGSWFADNDTYTPYSGHTTVGPDSGSLYAVTDQTGGGVHALTQSFTVTPSASSVLVSFRMFINNYASGFVNGPLSINSGSVEMGRVDILNATAGAFDTGAGVLQNLFTGGYSSGGSNFASYVYDITSLVGAGGTFQLRFAEADNMGYFNMGIDNVSITAASAAVPEPSSLALIGLALGGVAVTRRRARRC